MESCLHTKKHNTDPQSIITTGEKQNKGLDPRRNFPAGPGSAHLAAHLSPGSPGPKILIRSCLIHCVLLTTKPRQRLILLGVCRLCCLGRAGEGSREVPSHGCDWKLWSSRGVTQFCPWVHPRTGKNTKRQQLV